MNARRAVFEGALPVALHAGNLHKRKKARSRMIKSSQGFVALSEVKKTMLFRLQRLLPLASKSHLGNY